MKNIIIVFVLINLTFLAIAGVQDKVFQVKYLSAENVYIDAGKEDSLMIGDRLTILRDGKTIAEVEINYLSGNSASCKILIKNDDIKIGDRVEILQTVPRATNTEKISQSTKTRTFKQRLETKPQKKWAVASGTVAIQSYFWKDNNPVKNDFFQPSARLNFRLRKIWGYDLDFKINTRSVYNQRANVINPSLPKTEWQNRLYELSLIYEPVENSFGIRFGRILNGFMSGIGYIDGLQFHYKIKDNLKAGIFGGTQPDWDKGGFGQQIKKYGVFVNFVQGNYSEIRYEATLAAAAEYASNTISREFLYLSTQINSNNRWSLYQSMQLDVNNGWRADSSGNSLQISNLYIMGTYSGFDKIRLSLSYDTRTNYWTYITRDISSSFFDQETRHGLRAGITWLLPQNYKIYSTFGTRLRTGIDNTYSFGATISNSNIFKSHIKTRLSFNGYYNQFGSGLSPRFSIGKSVWSGGLVFLSYGIYHYSYANDTLTKNNQWLRINGDLNLFAGLYGSLQYEYDWGGDLEGHRSFAELGWRF